MSKMLNVQRGGWTSRISTGVLAVMCASCATSSGVPTPANVADRVEQQTGHRTREATAESALPSGVVLDDGLTEDEAVAIALWNNPAFQESLADLGIARAEVAQAGLLRNPILTLLLPWGPKQLEATAKWPIDAIWQRPKRLAAARLAADAVAERLVATGLSLVADTRLAFVDLAAAQSRAQLAAQQVELVRRIAQLARGRFDAGDISQLEADTFATDASIADQFARRLAMEGALARNRLHQILGVGELVQPNTITLATGPASLDVCNDLAALEKDAVASRPDLRAAELEIEAVARRLGWERSRIASFLVVLDANSQGTQGFELGPGIETDFGLFDRNQAGVARAMADLGRARARYQNTRQIIVRELRDAHAQLLTSTAAAGAWRDDIRPKLEQQARQSEGAYEAGELPYLAVLEAVRRLNDGRTSELDAEMTARRARVRLEQSVGRRCTPPSKDNP